LTAVEVNVPEESNTYKERDEGGSWNPVIQSESLKMRLY